MATRRKLKLNDLGAGDSGSTAKSERKELVTEKRGFDHHKDTYWGEGEGA